MIPSVTHPSISTTLPKIPEPAFALPSNFHQLSFLDQLKCIGFIDDNFNLLFTPSEILPIGELGVKRFQEMLEKEVQCTPTSIKLSDYISGFSKDLAHKGIASQTYLRGGYAAYVACIDDYFEFLLQEFLASKNLPKDLFALVVETEEAPHDVDLFDLVDNGMPPTLLSGFYLEFMLNLAKTKTQFLQKLIPTVSPLFPYQEDYVLFTIGNDYFQVDRIIGKLNHPYLFKRDDIRIKIENNQMGIPESAGNFWQMVVDRKLKIIRTEGWHEKDFRAGLAALQLIQKDHLLIEEGCTLQSIIKYALSTGSDKIFSGAVDRAKLHSKKPYGFLMSVLIAYSHAAPNTNLQILKDELGEIPPLATLYKLALLMTLFRSDTYSAVWDPSGLLILNWNGDRIIFPRYFSLTSQEKPFYKIDKWVSAPSSQLDPVYRVLDGELSLLERVLFELALQKESTPLTESMKDALVDYLLEEDGASIAPLLCPWLTVRPGILGWMKALFKSSFKHGLRLWNAQDKDCKLETLESIINQIAYERPHQAYALLDEAPKELRIKLLKKLLESPFISPKTAVQIMEELIAENAPDAPILFQTYKKTFKSIPEAYIRYVRLFHLSNLAKEWIESFPPNVRMDQTLSFDLHDKPLLDAICELPGINEAKLMEAFCLKGHPIFEGCPYAKLMALLIKVDAKQEVLKALAKIPFTSKEAILLHDWMKKNPALSMELVALLIEEKAGLVIALNYMIYLKKTKDPSFVTLWEKTLNRCSSPEALYALIPFYKNREWVKSVYGVEAEIKTKKWAKALVAQSSLNETDKAILRDILTRTKLIATPLALLKNYLESIPGKPIPNDKIKPYLDEQISVLLKVIKERSPLRFYFHETLYKLFKLGVAAKLLSIDVFPLILESTSAVMPHIDKDTIFDPLLDLLQTMPLADFGSDEVHNIFQAKLFKLFDSRKMTLSFISKFNIPPFPVLLYSLAQTCLKHAHLYKLITEKYIEGKVSKEEFQFEVRSLVQSFLSPLNGEELRPHEEPCLICINDLSFYLKKDKRSRAYEAFDYILKQQKPGTYIQQQIQYLKIRRDAEDFIIARTQASIKEGQLYASFVASIGDYLRKNYHLLTNLPIQDPFLDAFELESIHPITRVDFIRSWNTELEYLLTPLYTYYARIVKSAYEYNKTKLDPSTVFNALLDQIERLKGKRKLSQEEKKTEAMLIYRSACVYLTDKGLVDKIADHIGRATGEKIHAIGVRDINEDSVEEVETAPPVKEMIESITGEKANGDLFNCFIMACKALMTSILEEDPPQYYQFHTLLELVKGGLELGLDPSTCFLFLQTIMPKAPQYVLEYNNQVVYDPYVNLLQSLNVIDHRSQEKFDKLLAMTAETVDDWDKKLKLAIPSARNEPLGFLGFTEIQNINDVVTGIKGAIDQFVRGVISEMEFKQSLDALLSALAKNMVVEILTRNTDPCLKIVMECRPYFKNDEGKKERQQAQKALEYLLHEWVKKVPGQAQHVLEYLKYIGSKTALENLIIDLKQKKSLFLQYFIEVKQRLDMQAFHENVHLLDPVFDALQLDGLERIEKIELFKHWEKVLKRSKNPFYQYQAKKVASYIAFESKKIDDKDLGTFSGDWTLSLHRAKQISVQAFNTEQLAYFDIMSNYQTPEQLKRLREGTPNTLKQLEAFTSTEIQDTPTYAVLLNYVEAIEEKKIPLHELPAHYFRVLDTLTRTILEADSPQFYKFYLLMELINRGIEYNYDRTKCLAPLEMLKEKAPQYILEVDNKVIFDPYADLLQSFALFLINSSKSREQYDTFKKMIEKVFQNWMKKLGWSGKQSYIAYAKENKTIEFLNFDHTTTTRLISCMLNLHNGEYLKKAISKDQLKSKLNDLMIAITKDLPFKTFTRHTDPCIAAIRDILFALKFNTEHKPHYEAMDCLLELWSKKAPHLGYIKDYQDYLHVRKELADLVINFKTNDQPFFQLFENMENYFKGLSFELLHIHDPVLTIFANLLPKIEVIELLKLWAKVLKESKNPIAEYQAKKAANLIDYISKKLDKSDTDTFVGNRFIKLKKAHELPGRDIFDKEMNYFLKIAQLHYPPEEMREVPERIRRMLKMSEK